MRHLVLGVAVAAAAAFGCAGAFAADGTAYMDQCKANIKNEQMPPGAQVTDAQRLSLCQCIVDSGDQAVIDEALAMAKLPAQQRFQKFATASDKYKTTSAACRQKLNFPVPPAPPAGSTGSP